MSIIIVSWNTRDLLDLCLGCVYACVNQAGERGHLQAEVWVIDNGSSDGSAVMVRRRYPDVHLIHNKENVGFARANNQALRAARGRYLLLLNSDALVTPSALADLVTVMDAHPEAAVCSPLLLNADNTPQFCWARFPGLKSELTGGVDRSQSPYPMEAFARPDTSMLAPFVADWVGGACFLVRAEAALSVGLLREDFFMYSEETEWCHRFARAGWKTLLAPAVRVTHLGGQSSKAVPRATRARMFHSRLRLYRILHGPAGSVAPALVATLRFLLFSLKQRLHPSRWGGKKTLA
jgi:GT2 family glycosyltransferase